MDFRTIDYNPLFNHIRETLNLPSTVVLGMDVHPEQTKPEFISPNIVDYCGAFAAVCKWVEVSRFGFSIRYDTDTNQPMMWFGVQLRYESKLGGTNGLTILNAYYTNEDGWTFSK